MILSWRLVERRDDGLLVRDLVRLGAGPQADEPADQDLAVGRESALTGRDGFRCDGDDAGGRRSGGATLLGADGVAPPQAAAMRLITLANTASRPNRAWRGSIKRSSSLSLSIDRFLQHHSLVATDSLRAWPSSRSRRA